MVQPLGSKAHYEIEIQLLYYYCWPSGQFIQNGETNERDN